MMPVFASLRHAADTLMDIIALTLFTTPLRQPPLPPFHFISSPFSLLILRRD